MLTYIQDCLLLPSVKSGPIFHSDSNTIIYQLLDDEVQGKIKLHLPITTLSANVLKEAIDRSKQVGMNTHLAKPLNVEKLLKMLDQYIS